MITYRATAFAPLLLFLCSIGLPVSAAELIDAIKDGDEAKLKTLLAEGSDPDTATVAGEFTGKTALMWAAESGDATMCRHLIDAGAHVDARNAKGGTALMYAAVNGHTTVIRLLVESGADATRQVSNGWSPLMLAAAKGEVRAARQLVQLGADPDQVDVYGWTPLMRATHNGHTGMVRELLDLGADPSVSDGQGVDALAIARSIDSRELANLLEAHDTGRL
ncbi:ankyrin repeat domain-containing protein [Methylonatrum kenyense]|uniref:ankyrin repeat domain-containing protein n=1 Tax=Methylonatrum kenyense TaxID=455253 RepID=UPI0020BF4CEB|nr:ankyrin repeat domain-containing protein [Methylonatrum kenyense]MCK8514823.1 ankyrin repeat domain-containing protein [Methylonatrum kenyense]